MKNTIIKAVITITLINLSVTAIAQKMGKENVGTDKNSARIESNAVPVDVTKSYEKDYSLLPIKSWYNYDPAFAGESWEEYDPYDYTKAHTKSYQVDFKKGNVDYSVVYTAKGKKVLIRRSLMSDLPKSIVDNINKTQYKNWALGKDKEEIFKNEENGNVKIYKVTMTKGNERHILYFKPDGRLMKVIKH